MAKASPPVFVATIPITSAIAAAIATVAPIAGTASQPFWQRYPKAYAPTASQAA